MVCEQMARDKIAFLASETPQATDALIGLRRQYDDVGTQKADVIVALGGDGFMLSVLHDTQQLSVPIYGMNQGTIGFLMNSFSPDNLLDRIAAAELSMLHPLSMTATDSTGARHEAMAINEVSVFRETRQAAKIRISIDGNVRIEELVCDGVLVATPAGSTAYNLSAHGSIIPLDAEILALTPISAFRPRRWRGALLPGTAQVEFKVLEPEKRPVSVVADNQEFRSVIRIKVVEDQSAKLRLLFDPEHNLEERILNEQFIP
ncbi:MAG: NAD kinase [Alphaproteobacteria bacterium MarineAlpha1_Bin1]|nr:MAG: NAD kinase [Alphaproteobacteria bacterium MarineAlpha1_Bin1]